MDRKHVHDFKAHMWSTDVLLEWKEKPSHNLVTQWDNYKNTAVMPHSEKIDPGMEMYLVAKWEKSRKRGRQVRQTLSIKAKNEQ